MPQITLALKRVVDADKRPGQYVLMGSSDIFTTAAAYDSLAGRVMTLTLRPFSAAEIAGNGPCARVRSSVDRLPQPGAMTRAQAIALIVCGGFPEIRGLSAPDRMDRYRSYLDSIVERDVAQDVYHRQLEVQKRI